MGLKAAAQQKVSEQIRPSRSRTASTSSPSRSPANHLQKAIGNTAMTRLLRSGQIQAKLTVSHPGDVYEREADRVADQVMRMPDSQGLGALTSGGPGVIHRKCACDGAGGDCTECKEKSESTLHRTASQHVEPEHVPSLVHEVLRSPGQSLDVNTRTFMEPRFNRDFSGVRVHTDNRAAESARSVNALAFTVGSNIVFSAGQYNPKTSHGQRLVAHELTHVVQQGAVARGANQINRYTSHPSGREVGGLPGDRMPQQVVDGGSVKVPPQVGGAITIQRLPKVGTRFKHPAGKKSAFKKIEATFDGRNFDVKGDGTSVLNTPAQSGRPVAVRPADAKACKGSTSESYLNNARYVGIRDYGAIPEGDYHFSATSFATFSTTEQAQMIAGGYFTDPFGATIHGGDWGAGRAPLTPKKLLPSACGNTKKRSGFFLHGGTLTGSSGCIDVGNTGVSSLLPLLEGFTKPIVVRVRYTHPPPSVGKGGRVLGGFVYPGQENPSIEDRLKGAAEQLFGPSDDD